MGINMRRYYTTGLVNFNMSKIIELINKNCFNILIFKSKKDKLGEGVSISFTVNSPDKNLLIALSNVLGGCGKVVARTNYFCFIVNDLKSISEKVIPFLENCILHEVRLGRALRPLEIFKYWKKAVNFMNQGTHTTLEGLIAIKEIKLLMHNLKINKEFSLVLYGSNLLSTVGYPKFSFYERSLIRIPANKISIFIGIILSDASLQRVNKGGEARLQLKQKYSQFEYLYSVFFQLSHYCSRGPAVTKAILHNKYFYALCFTTRSLPCITELYDLFYPEGKKVIPHNIYDLLTWEALAHWIHGDGTYNSGIAIQTQSFTIKDLVLLVNVLIIKFRLECSIQTQGKYNVIYIKSKSIKKNLHHLLPFIHPTMLYKFKGPQYKLKSKYSTIK